MRILVIGGTGLISTAIVQQLLDRGDGVTVFNRGQTPVRVQGPIEVVLGNRWEPGSLERAGQRGTAATILRPSFTTGEGATAAGLLFDDALVSRMRTGRPVIVMEDGRTPWAIAHVSDVARGFVASLGNPRAAGNDYHLTSHE